jgi:integrase
MSLLDTGARRDEMIGLTLDDVDLDLDMLVVLGKGRRERSLPFGHRAGEALDRYLRARARHKHAGLPWLWLGRQGRPHGLGASDDAAPSWPQGRAAQAAPASVQAHGRSPLAACRTCVGAAGAAAAGRPVGHHLSCSFTSPPPEGASTTSDLVTVSALSEKTENRRT